MKGETILGIYQKRGSINIFLRSKLSSLISVGVSKFIFMGQLEKFLINKKKLIYISLQSK